MDIDWINQISGIKIESIINDIYKISKGPMKGRIAYAFTKMEDEIFEYLKSYIYDLNSTYGNLNRNLDTYEDAIGNLYISLDSDKDKFAACGSHVDSVIDGGAYDGVAGVAAALEIFRVFFQNDIQAKCGFRIIVFRGEESTMTGEALMGSGVATGQIDDVKLNEMKYGLKEKIPFEEYMKNLGYNWQDVVDSSENPIIMPSLYQCYLEMHIEQGTVLEKMGLNVGIVDKGIGGATRMELKTLLKQKMHKIGQDEEVFVFSVKGRADHTGGTPMNGVRGENYRDDAMVKAALLIEDLINNAGGKIVKWYTKNFAYNIVPGQVEFIAVLKKGWRERIDFNLYVDDVDATEEDYKKERTVWNAKAVKGAIEIVKEVERLGEQYAANSDGLVCTTIGGVGRVDNELRMTFDLRTLDDKMRNSILVELKKLIDNNGFDFEEISKSTPVNFDKKVPKSLGLIYKELFGREPFYLPSMPGHDARNMAKSGIQTGMIFVACKGGYSHSPKEYVSPIALEEGARLLGAGLVYFANRC